MTARDSLMGLSLATLVLGAWGGLLALSLFVVDWGSWWPLAPLVVAVQCWLFVGLFIVAHDAIHGTLCPSLPRLNYAIGALCVLLYAGFSYRDLARAHHAHHRHSGTEHDPDFHADGRSGFLPWYLAFFRHYFGRREFVFLALVSVALALAMGPRAPLMLVFWALPAILSSVQLFTFGTYLPHRHDGTPFADRHRTRSVAGPWLWSLLTCFHFGHHHAHHAQPSLPWWRLPSAAREEARP